MTEYLIAFNDEWVPDHTVEELREKSKAVRALVADMKAAGVFIFTGGLDDAVRLGTKPRAFSSMLSCRRHSLGRSGATRPARRDQWWVRTRRFP